MMEHNRRQALPVPEFFDPARVGEVWQVPYQERASQARQWADRHQIVPAAADSFRVLVFGVDIQNTFCIPGFELFVGGRSGVGAVEDNLRLCEFIYRNLGRITRFVLTMDTHYAMQIFHPILLVDSQGQHPDPYTLVTYEDVRSGRWKFNTAVAEMLGITEEYGQAHLLHYTQELQNRQKFDLTIWPYHAMLGSIGHALVPAVEEAVFFHSIARYSQPEMEIKGKNPLTEHYSAIGPEVLTGPDNRPIDSKNEKLVQMVQEFDAVVVAGQAKSHCVAWTVADLLEGIRQYDESLAGKVYLLDDASSPVVVPGAIDYTDAAETEYCRFEAAGMHRVRTTDPMETWPGIKI